MQCGQEFASWHDTRKLVGFVTCISIYKNNNYPVLRYVDIDKILNTCTEGDIPLTLIMITDFKGVNNDIEKIKCFKNSKYII